LRRLIAERRVDLVHTNGRIGTDREAILAAWLAGVPCLCHLRAFDSPHPFDRWLCRLIDQAIYISRAVEDNHLILGLPRERGRVVYNGLDLDEFRNLPDQATARAEWDLDAQAKVIGVIGRIEHWKGHHIFIRALARVLSEEPAVVGVIAGAPERYSQVYYTEIQNLAAQLGILEQVRFMGFQQGVSRLLPALDVVVHASLEPEPFGRVIIEGMAAGRPVVGTAAGAVPEIIDDGVTGRLVPPGDPDAMAEAILDLLRHPEVAAEMGRRARETVAARFSVEQYVAGVEAVYRALWPEI